MDITAVSGGTINLQQTGGIIVPIYHCTDYALAALRGGNPYSRCYPLIRGKYALRQIYVQFNFWLKELLRAGLLRTLPGESVNCSYAAFQSSLHRKSPSFL